MGHGEYVEGGSAEGGSAEVREARAPEAEGAAVVIPDEETFVLPDSWRRLLHPRRGSVPRKPAAASQSAVADFEECLAKAAPRIAACLESPESEPGLVEAARAHLAGSQDPVGAGAVLAMAEDGSHFYSGGIKHWVDAHVALYGLPFTARAVIEYLDLHVDTDLYRPRGKDASLKVLQQGLGSYRVTGRRALVDRARALLAACDEETYARTVEAVGRQLGTGRRRIVAAYLLPTETEWVEACCADPGSEGEQSGEVRALLMGALGSPEQLERLGGTSYLGRQGWSVATIATLAEGIGVAAEKPLIEQMSDAHLDSDGLRTVAKALAEFPTEEAFAALLHRVGDKKAGPALQEAVTRWPVRALRQLARASARDGSVAGQLLRGLVHGQRALVEAVLPSLPEDVAAVVRPLAEKSGRLPEATAGDLPAVLVSPPWTRTDGRIAAPRAVTGLTASAEASVVWLPGEREQWERTRSCYHDGYFGRRASELRPEEVRWALVENSMASAALFVLRPEEEVRPWLDSWSPSDIWDAEGLFEPVAARFGLDALGLLRRVAARRPALLGHVLLPFVDVVVARMMADWLTRPKSVSSIARSWFQRHGSSAAGLLVPNAVGKAGPARSSAERALRLIASQEGSEVVLAAAASYGEKAVEAVDVLLHADPLRAALPSKMPVVPVWAEAGLLPQITVRGGAAALPVESARHVLTMLALSKPGEPYPGVATVLEVCDRASLAEFGWALFEQWRLAGLPAQESWALHALGLIGDDGTVRRLTPLLRIWPGAGAHHRAVEGLEVLAAIGSDVALLHLHGIAQRVKFKALKAKAQEKIQQIAETLGLTGEQLADRLVPDLGLDTDGSTVVDYGTRKFTVGFDEQLRPYVRDADGKRLKDLPKPGAKDDAELAPAERKRFMALKKDVRTLASDQVRRLEAAMVAGRSWTAEEFRDLLVAHPLVWHLVRRLVWVSTPAGEGARGTAFRVAEDRTFADAEDDAFTVPEGAAVRLAHPLTLGEEAVSVWSEVFADYEILQPFAQLGRPVHRLTAEEATSGRLPRFEGLTVPTTKMLGLTKRGWDRGIPQDAGVENEITKKLGEDLYLVIDLDGGIAVGAIDVIPEQKLRMVGLYTRPEGHWSGRENGLRFGDLDPVASSELLADLTDLTEGAAK
ncbi:hypothetical protein GCM10010329_41240 [Streptomyces spiroverticillatus]|uniref:DUF4132 domain-containing protein n=1 Tax=Streptomyces finlayi TaxID=67296 RepID=A0A918WZ78_9ACTN|nr:DUF4132 domain-containing protein [Streptomyces finlayi]GHA14105.1 hypothetical protein GCM10010329_41240 [Streptomyces spiroverticillatus]GHC97524.1 hypothetical protein GCM10010334_39000 [Streptomyces finlayi]